MDQHKIVVWVEGKPISVLSLVQAEQYHFLCFTIVSCNNHFLLWVLSDNVRFILFLTHSYRLNHSYTCIMNLTVTTV